MEADHRISGTGLSDIHAVMVNREVCHVRIALQSRSDSVRTSVVPGRPFARRRLRRQKWRWAGRSPSLTPTGPADSDHGDPVTATGGQPDPGVAVSTGFGRPAAGPARPVGVGPGAGAPAEHSGEMPDYNAWRTDTRDDRVECACRRPKRRVTSPAPGPGRTPTMRRLGIALLIAAAFGSQAAAQSSPPRPEGEM